jgi:serine phosphatase RsbU (regulator of sigma subunit)
MLLRTKIIVALALLLGLNNTLSAQDKMITDGLLKELQDANTDKVRCEVHAKLADEYLFTLPDSAEFHAIKAHLLAEELEDYTILARMCNFRGIILHNQGHYLSALEWYQKSRTIYAQQNDMGGAVKVVNNIGIIYSVIGEFNKAIGCYIEAYQYNLKQGNKVAASTNLFNIAIGYIESKQFELARGYVQKLIELQDGNPEIAKPESLEAEILANDGRLEEAIAKVDSAIVYLKMDPDLSNEGSLLVLKGKILSKMNKFDEALSLFHQAEVIASENDFNDIILAVLQEKAKIMSAMGQHERAYRYQVQLYDAKDSLARINNINLMGEMNAKYEAEKRDAEIARQAQQLQNKNFWMFVIGLSSIALAVIIFMIYFTLQKKKRLNGLLTRQNFEIKSQRQKIISSISYAKRIQHSSLTAPGKLKEYFLESFILFRPKDIVSGDFYWFREIDGKMFLAVVDCTGHGVPGAFMSLIASEKLNMAVGELKLREPGDIITAVNKQIVCSLDQENAPENAQDGLDLSLCVIDPLTGEIKFSGANSSILHISSSGDMQEIKSNALGVGGSMYGKMYKNGFNFETTQFKYQKGDSLFMYSDGFFDQFGGFDSKKFNKGQFREMLRESSKIGLNNAHDFCNNILEQWMGSNTQTDDILVLGVKL